MSLNVKTVSFLATFCRESSGDALSDCSPAAIAGVTCAVGPDSSSFSSRPPVSIDLAIFLGTCPRLKTVMAPPPALGFINSIPSAVRATKAKKKAQRKPKLRQRWDREYVKDSWM
jgi:hypothetical protein